MHTRGERPELDFFRVSDELGVAFFPLLGNLRVAVLIHMNSISTAIILMKIVPDVNIQYVNLCPSSNYE